MWRNYVICVLIGLLIATSVTSLNLFRQTQSDQSANAALRQRALAAEATSSAVQQQPDVATPEPQSVSIAPVAPAAATTGTVAATTGNVVAPVEPPKRASSVQEPPRPLLKPNGPCAINPVMSDQDLVNCGATPR